MCTVDRSDHQAEHPTEIINQPAQPAEVFGPLTLEQIGATAAMVRQRIEDLRNSKQQGAFEPEVVGLWIPVQRLLESAYARRANRHADAPAYAVFEDVDLSKWNVGFDTASPDGEYCAFATVKDGRIVGVKILTDKEAEEFARASGDALPRIQSVALLDYDLSEAAKNGPFAPHEFPADVRIAGNRIEIRSRTKSLNMKGALETTDVAKGIDATHIEPVPYPDDLGTDEARITWVRDTLCSFHMRDLEPASLRITGLAARTHDEDRTPLEWPKRDLADRIVRQGLEDARRVIRFASTHPNGGVVKSDSIGDPRCGLYDEGRGPVKLYGANGQPVKVDTWNDQQRGTFDVLNVDARCKGASFSEIIDAFKQVTGAASDPAYRNMSALRGVIKTLPQEQIAAVLDLVEELMAVHQTLATVELTALIEATERVTRFHPECDAEYEGARSGVLNFIHGRSIADRRAICQAAQIIEGERAIAEENAAHEAAALERAEIAKGLEECPAGALFRAYKKVTGQDPPLARVGTLSENLISMASEPENTKTCRAILYMARTLHEEQSQRTEELSARVIHEDTDDRRAEQLQDLTTDAMHDLRQHLEAFECDVLCEAYNLQTVFDEDGPSAAEVAQLDKAGVINLILSMPLAAATQCRTFAQEVFDKDTLAATRAVTSEEQVAVPVVGDHDPADVDHEIAQGLIEQVMAFEYTHLRAGYEKALGVTCKGLDHEDLRRRVLSFNDAQIMAVVAAATQSAAERKSAAGPKPAPVKEPEPPAKDPNAKPPVGATFQIDPTIVLQILMHKADDAGNDVISNEVCVPIWKVASVLGKYGVHMRALREAAPPGDKQHARQEVLAKLRKKCAAKDTLQIPVV